MGSYAITVSGAYDPNYTIGYVNGTLTIDKASAKIVVTPYNVPYDGNPHTATGTATGVESPTPANLEQPAEPQRHHPYHRRQLHRHLDVRRQRELRQRQRHHHRCHRQPGLTVSSITAVSPNPRNSYVSSIDVTFNEPINTSSLTSGALTLTDDGGSNLINGGVSLSLVSGDTYAIGGLMGLTTAQGEYMLTVNAADIQDQNGVAGTDALSTSWLMDTTPPTSTVSSLPPADNLDELRRVGQRHGPGRSQRQHAVGHRVVRDLRVEKRRSLQPIRHGHARRSLGRLRRPGRQ